MTSEQTTLAICIPTRERARYLDCLLTHLAEILSEFPYSYEIIISDNASTDNTQEIVEKWSKDLPIRYFKQATNIGMFRNPRFVLEKSNSQFSLCVADDDLLELEGLKSAIETLLNEPDAVILYAPWVLYDLVNKTTLRNFFDIPKDIVVNHGNFAHLLSLILQHHIFAEIPIVRTEAFKKLTPGENKLAFFAFTVPAEYLALGKVLFQKAPFYKSVTAYFADEGRVQAGHAGAEKDWDSYGGGLEHLLGLAMPALTDENIAMLREKIREFVTMRMLVALRLRVNTGRDPIESYYLASRLRGLGAKDHLPRPFEIIRAQAALWFVTHDENLVEGVQTVILVGGFEKSVADFLETICDLKILHSEEFPRDVDHSILILKGGAASYEYDVENERARYNRIILERELMNKFL